MTIEKLRHLAQSKWFDYLGVRVLIPPTPIAALPQGLLHPISRVMYLEAIVYGHDQPGRITVSGEDDSWPRKHATETSTLLRVVDEEVSYLGPTRFTSIDRMGITAQGLDNGVFALFGIEAARCSPNDALR